MMLQDADGKKSVRRQMKIVRKYDSPGDTA
jgi:hypothetical protein